MAGNVTISEAPTTGLGRLITENRFFVPTHQRDYKWDRDRVERFIEDLTQAMERGDKFYFIGLMVFMGSNDGRLRVLDGQQRLATSIIIFSALRTWFAVAGEDPMRIQYDFIGRADYGESKAEPKISMNRNNDDKFQCYVTEQSPTEAIKAELAKTGKNDSNYNLLDAVVFCRQFITDRAAAIANAAKAKKYFADFIKFMRDSVIAVRLTVPNESNAFRVFETLNDRGMDLSAVDLLKNYLFGCVYDEGHPQGLAQMEHRWALLTGTLQDLRQEDFLKVKRRFFAVLRQGPVTSPMEAVRAAIVKERLMSTVSWVLGGLAAGCAIVAAFCAYKGATTSATPPWERDPGLKPKNISLPSIGDDQA
jgi:Protein of unknown function DUF262